MSKVKLESEVGQVPPDSDDTPCDRMLPMTQRVKHLVGCVAKPVIGTLPDSRIWKVVRRALLLVANRCPSWLENPDIEAKRFGSSVRGS